MTMVSHQRHSTNEMIECCACLKMSIICKTEWKFCKRKTNFKCWIIDISMQCLCHCITWTHIAILAVESETKFTYNSKVLGQSYLMKHIPMGHVLQPYLKGCEVVSFHKDPIASHRAILSFGKNILLRCIYVFKRFLILWITIRHEFRKTSLRTHWVWNEKIKQHIFLEEVLMLDMEYTNYVYHYFDILNLLKMCLHWENLILFKEFLFLWIWA
jgi:hypothetical protein